MQHKDVKKRKYPLSLYLYLALMAMLVIMTFIVTNAMVTSLWDARLRSALKDKFEAQQQLETAAAENAGLKVQHDQDINFTKSYSSAVNNINQAYYYLTVARLNLNKAGEYVSSMDTQKVYYLLNLADQQATKGEQLLSKAKYTLLSQDNFPNRFFQIDTGARLKESEASISYVATLKKLIFYMKSHTESLAKGSYDSADEYLTAYSVLIPTLNSEVTEIRASQNNISREWNEDWTLFSIDTIN